MPRSIYLSLLQFNKSCKNAPSFTSASSISMFSDDSDESQPSNPTCSSIELSQQACRLFEFAEILLATNNFAESLVIGRGGFGKVYKGNIITGSSISVAAIKRLDPMSSQGASEFWAEVQMLSNYHHPHLASLFGYCNYEKEMILVYEYMPNGTLEDHLHKLGTPLSWFLRLKICVASARGLHYLHTGTGINVGVIHRDVKSSNILLDERWEAKISDFGLSKIGPTNQPLTYVDTRVKGTFGYLDPDYSFTGRLTRKSDVYAFGVVLLEVLCRRPALDLRLDEEQHNLARWAQESIKEGNLKHIIDSGIRNQISPKSLKEFVRIAGRCLHNKQKERPTMAEVLFSLESLLTIQQNMNSPLQPSQRTILGRVVDKLTFTSNIENSGKRIFGRTAVSVIERSYPCRKFEFAEILIATNNFDESLVIARGRSGKLYKGLIVSEPSHVVASIKRLGSMSSQGASEFWAEVELLSRLRHSHLVSFFGYCNHEDEMILVYEYMPNGTLEDHLHKLGTPLSWLQRLKICISAARGLDYLHTGTGIDFGVIHRDVNSSNILLHESWAAKISDFGLSKIVATNQPSTNDDFAYVTTCVVGTLGYLDPEYYMSSRLTTKSDVYSFGVVLLEMLCRRHVINRDDDSEIYSLVQLAHEFIEQDNLNQIVDLGIRDQISPDCLKKFAQIVEGCLHIESKKRPTMADVVFDLQSVLTIQEKTNSLLQPHSEQ
ncbi:proline-rich receptor-like protein kinase PERK8 [Lactuca sativa]|uniref:Protein kinase domain-containing protein n=1 Tax=Lactuca sativa TaxID=4236 RepID=A0A9R1V3W8_LACSA|nr:proline-rich receptor-like protein kinase PERK8 [Lactuca sativa]KAJ0197913.1 hypothetical protein LSAT_V11C700367330 [Lactuca sativa]